MEIVDYGVCRLSVVPVRLAPTHQAEQITQLLFGDHYAVTETVKEKRWIRVKINYDQYEGWIDESQHHSVTQEYFEYLNRAEFKIATDLTSSILYNKSPQIILMGSIIPISSSELFKMEEQFAFNGETKNMGQKREFEFVKTIALKYLNSPYLWGGKSPFGIDCSGFTQMVYKICGYKLFRDSRQQASQGRAVQSLEVARPGDLAFFDSAEGKIVHVGMLLEENKIIHASGRVRIDYINEEGILNMDTKIYSHHLASIRRMLAE
ncbi:MAG: C40 family peptidase [Cyclobacteriaceae bacterium]|nr:C40 family peptidase [Cyclobacteriaceae bacterium]